MERSILNFLLQSTKGNLFILNKNNEYVFRNGMMKNTSFETLYIQYGDQLIDYLMELNQIANIVDRKIIYGIKKRIIL